MSSIDDAIAEALRRQKEGLAPAAAARKTAIVNEGEHAHKQAAQDRKEEPVDPWSPEATLRAANEDDDLYDPYSDYMDALARNSYEELEEDPWR